MISLNDKDLAVFGISKVVKFHANTTSYSNIGAYFGKGNLKPIKGKKYETYRVLNAQFLFKGDSRVQILKNISIFIEESKEGIFYRDGFYYEVEITDSVEPEILSPNVYILTLSYSLLNMYELEKTVTVETSKTISINSPKPCYANLELSANTNVISYTVTINDSEIVVKNIKGNETVYIGSGKVIAGGKSKIDDVELWEFPILKPGINNITVNRADVNLKIKYNERW